MAGDAKAVARVGLLSRASRVRVQRGPGRWEPCGERAGDGKAESELGLYA